MSTPVAPLPVTVRTGIDPVLRDSAVLGALADVRDAVVVRHDLSELSTGVVRRVVSDAAGVFESVRVPLAHARVSGALCEDAVPVLDQLAVAPGTLRLADPEEVPGTDLLAPRRDPTASRWWEDPRHAAPNGAPDGHGVWTLDLSDWRPFHPDRFTDHLEDLACGALAGRGRFWLPTRPHLVGVWAGAGRQLSLGSAGTWRGRAPSTRLVVTGVGADPARVRAAFDRWLADVVHPADAPGHGGRAGVEPEEAA